VIPVVDLVKVLNRGHADTGSNGRIVVLEVEGLVLGLQVDAATDVLSFDTQQLEDVPDLATHAGYDAVRNVVRRPNETPIMVLAVEALIENIYRSALPVAAARREVG
jgi:purine-binding chemotaxis protein CheW